MSTETAADAGSLTPADYDAYPFHRLPLPMRCALYKRKITGLSYELFAALYQEMYYRGTRGALLSVSDIHAMVRAYGVKERTVRAALKRLREAGLIARTPTENPQMGSWTELILEELAPCPRSNTQRTARPQTRPAPPACKQPASHPAEASVPETASTRPVAAASPPAIPTHLRDLPPEAQRLYLERHSASQPSPPLPAARRSVQNATKEGALNQARKVSRRDRAAELIEKREQVQAAVTRLYELTPISMSRRDLGGWVMFQLLEHSRDRSITLGLRGIAAMLRKNQFRAPKGYCARTGEALWDGTFTDPGGTTPGLPHPGATAPPLY